MPKSLSGTSAPCLARLDRDLMLGETSFTLTQNGEVLQSVAYTYDDLNRLTTVSENGAQQAAYTYDTNGNRASLTYANGVTETYRYNKANWIISLENRNNSGLISSYTYTYYASGSQKTKTAADGKVTSYVYDGLNRLVQESETGALTQSYTYDARGNRAAMTVTGTESYAVSYTYDANNRLLTEQKTQGLLTDLTTYTYDANGNLLSKTVLAGNGGAAGSTYVYNTLNQLVSATENQRTAAYAYNAQGIRTAKVTFSTRTNYLLDGANVVGERLNGEYVSYLRGANLISRTGEDGTDYYLFNAHGDVTGLADSTGASARAYDYDAFGVEKDPDPLDENPFRYCGEYFDRETETYYLRARYYDPTIGRFTQQDTHWTTANSIYGDNPQKINEREDKLGLKTYSYAPQITAVMQSGNLYVYGVNNSVYYADSNGNEIAIACAIVLVVLAIGTAVAVFAILQKVIPDAYAASVDLLHEFCVLVKAAKESLEEYIKRKAAEYVASQAQTAAGMPDPDDNRKNWKKIASEYLEQKLNKQGTDAHKVKQEYLGKKANISQYDIYVNKDTGQLGLFEKSTGNFVGYLDYFIK